MSTFAERMKHTRIKQGLTQKQMAERLYISPSNFAKYERGECGISIDTAIDVSRVLGVSLDWLAGKGALDEQ